MTRPFIFCNLGFQQRDEIIDIEILHLLRFHFQSLKLAAVFFFNQRKSLYFRQEIVLRYAFKMPIFIHESVASDPVF